MCGKHSAQLYGSALPAAVAVSSKGDLGFISVVNGTLEKDMTSNSWIAFGVGV